MEGLMCVQKRGYKLEQDLILHFHRLVTLYFVVALACKCSQVIDSIQSSAVL